MKKETVSYPEYVFIAFSFNHFDLENEDLTTELIRVGTKITQKLGYKYFWVSASCMGFSEDEERTLSEDEKKKISEQDVSGSVYIHTGYMNNLVAALRD